MGVRHATFTDAPEENTSAVLPAIGYLVSQYPATSHTFILREVQELRKQGLRVETFSVRRPSEAEVAGGATREEYLRTFYLLPLNLLGFLSAHAKAAFTSPRCYLLTLAMALRHRAPGAKSLLWALFHFAEAIRLAAELKRRKIRHLHNHFANSGANVGFLAAGFLNLPWSLTLHGISEFDYPAGLLLPEKISRARFIACVSYFGQAQAMRISSSHHWAKMMLVRCGLDLAALPARDMSPKLVPSINVICVGRLSPEKGHLGLLKAFGRIARLHPQTRLRLVGDGPCRSIIERSIESEGLQDRVTLLGRLDEERTLLEISRADLLVLPSFMEGLPVVLMEALALEVPVLASHVAGIPELLTDETGGLMFEPGNWNDLAQKLGFLLSDHAFRRHAAKLGRARIERDFSIDKAVVPLVEAFRSSLSGGPISSSEQS